jgi:hypothetical protein
MGEVGCTWCGERDCTCDGDVYIDFTLVGPAREFTQWVSPRDRRLMQDGQRLTLWGDGGSPARAVVVRVRGDDPDVTFRLLRPGELRPGE